MSTSEARGDRIVLTLPGGEALRDVASLVIGGVGTRVDLPYEKVDDLQLAVLSVLASSDAGTVTLDIEIDAGRLAVTIGPLVNGGATDQGLRRVLVRLVDTVEPGRARADSRDGEWITLRLDHPGSGTT